MAFPIAIIGLIKLAALFAAQYGLSRLLTPKRPAQEVGRLSGQIQLQDSSYGVAIPRIYGGTSNNPLAEFTWGTLVNMSQGFQRQVIKDGGSNNSWDAKAESVETFGYANAGTSFGPVYELEFVRRGSGTAACGVVPTGFVSSNSPSGFAFGIVAYANGTIECWADGALIFQSAAGVYADGEKLRIEVVLQNPVFYYKDTRLTLWSQNAFSGDPGPYKIRATAYSTGAMISEVRIWQPGTTSLITPATEPVFSKFINTKYDPTNGRVTKIGGVDGTFDAVAIGAEAFAGAASASNSARFLWRIPALGKWAVGFTTNQNAASENDFNLVIIGQADTTLRFYKKVSGSLVQQGGVSNYAAGDVLRFDLFAGGTILFPTNFGSAEVRRVAGNVQLGFMFTGPEYDGNDVLFPGIALATQNFYLDQFLAGPLTETGHEPPVLEVDLGGIVTGGNVLWASKIREHSRKKKVGGKGGGGSKVTEYSYDIDLAIAIGEGPLQLLAMWAGTDLLIDFRGNAVGTGVYDSSLDSSGTGYTFGVTGPDADEIRRYLGTSTSARTTLPTGDAFGVVSGVTAKTLATFRFYQGNEIQLPDPLIEADIGVGNTPAYRGLSYMTLEKFFFKFSNIQKDSSDTGYDYGGIPNFRFLVLNQNTQTVEEICVEISERSGMAPADFDYSDGNDILCRGLMVNNREPGRTALEHLERAYGLDFYQAEGLTSLVKRGQASLVTIDVEELGFAEGLEPQEERRGLMKQLANESELPGTINLNFLDPDPAVNFNTNSKQYRRGLTTSSREDSIDVPITLVAQDAQNIVNRIGNEAWSARTGYEFILSYKYVWLKASDVITITDGTFSHEMQLTQVEGAAPGTLLCRARKVDSGQYSITRPAPTFTTQNQTPIVFAPAVGVILDVVTLRDRDDKSGWYFAAAPFTPTASFGGAVLFEERSANNYEEMASVNIAATIGKAINSLGQRQSQVWDHDSVLVVDLNFGTLESVTEAELYAGANAAMYGNEIIQFLNAEQLDGYPNRWKLWGILSARKGTDDGVWTNNGTHAAAHADGERFVLLNDAVIFVETALTNRDVAKNYKIVGSGENIDAVPIGVFTYQANNLKPLAPVYITGSRDGSNNLTINWVRRGRLQQDLSNLTDVPLDEPTEIYSVDILNGATVVRTLPDVTSPTAAYSAANQTADGLTPGNPVKVRIYQISSRVGRGKPGEAVI